MSADHEGEIFSSILDLEEQYHTEGYALGVADGAKSGRIEGRVFGLEKGFEKFLQLGKLQGRAEVWQLDPQVKANDRLRKHVERLASLTASEDLTTENDEDAVNEVEDKIRDARGKERIIRRILGDVESYEPETIKVDGQLRILQSSSNRSGNASSTKSVASPEMEDFVGIPNARAVG